MLFHSTRSLFCLLLPRMPCLLAHFLSLLYNWVRFAITSQMNCTKVQLFKAAQATLAEYSIRLVQHRQNKLLKKQIIWCGSDNLQTVFVFDGLCGCSYTSQQWSPFIPSIRHVRADILLHRELLFLKTERFFF